MPRTGESQAGIYHIKGNVYAFAYAPCLGAPGRGPVVSAVAAPDGGGYWILFNNGAVYAFGDAPYLGGMAGTPLNRAIIAASGS